jgi:hypothetical protein
VRKENEVSIQPEVSLDLETLDLVGSKKKMAGIMSIGAVSFNPTVLLSQEDIISEEQGAFLKDGRMPIETFQDLSNPNSVGLFYTPVSLYQTLRHGFTHDPETIKWWEKQSYNMLEVAAGHREKLIDTFARLAAWLKVVKPRRVWANAPTFDCAILRDAFDHMGLELDIYFRDERDVRTAREFAEVGEATSKSPAYYVKHHALFDAAWEAHVIQAMYERKRFITSELVELQRLRAMEYEMLAVLAKSKDYDKTPPAEACQTVEVT